MIQKCLLMIKVAPSSKNSKLHPESLGEKLHSVAKKSLQTILGNEGEKSNKKCLKNNDCMANLIYKRQRAAQTNHQKKR